MIQRSCRSRVANISTARAAAAGDTDTVSAANSVRRDHLDVPGNSVSWKVFPVQRDDHPGPADDGGRNDVLIVGIGQRECALERLPTGHHRITRSTRASSRPAAHQPFGPPPESARAVRAWRPHGTRGSSRITSAHNGRYKPSTAIDSRKSRCRLGQRTVRAVYRPPADAVSPRRGRAVAPRPLLCAQLLRPHRRIVIVVDLHPRLRKRLVLAGRPLLLLLEHIPQQQPMPVANSRCRLPTFSAGNSPTSINRRTVGRLTPSRSAACCVVDIVARGATVTARPDPSAATTCLSAACTSAGNST